MQEFVNTDWCFKKAEGGRVYMLLWVLVSSICVALALKAFSDVVFALTGDCYVMFNGEDN